MGTPPDFKKRGEVIMTDSQKFLVPGGKKSQWHHPYTPKTNQEWNSARKGKVWVPKTPQKPQESHSLGAEMAGELQKKRAVTRALASPIESHRFDLPCKNYFAALTGKRNAPMSRLASNVKGKGREVPPKLSSQPLPSSQGQFKGRGGQLRTQRHMKVGILHYWHALTCMRHKAMMDRDFYRAHMPWMFNKGSPQKKCFPFSHMVREGGDPYSPNVRN